MENKKKIDDQIMKKLEANTIRRPICLTNKGALELVIVKGGNEYYLTLDSVPVEKELNRELMDILFRTLPNKDYIAINTLNGGKEAIEQPVEKEKIIVSGQFIKDGKRVHKDKIIKKVK